MLWSLLKAHFKNPCLAAKMNLNWPQNIFMKVNINSSVLQAFCCPHPSPPQTASSTGYHGPQFPYLLIRF